MWYEMFYYFGLGIVFLALVFVLICFLKLKSLGEGKKEMKEIAKIIRDGAFTFMKTEYVAISVTIALNFALIAGIVALCRHA